MLLQGLAGHNNVIKVDEDEGKSGQNSTIRWKVLPAFLKPNGRRRNLKWSKGVMMAVLGMSSGCIKLENNLFSNLFLKKKLHPVPPAEKSIMLGRGYTAMPMSVIRITFLPGWKWDRVILKAKEVLSASFNPENG